MSITNIVSKAAVFVAAVLVHTFAFATANGESKMYQVLHGKLIFNASNIFKIEDQGKESFRGTITLEPQDFFTIMDEHVQADRSRLLRLGIDSDLSAEPNVIWVQDSTLESAQITLVDLADSIDPTLLTGIEQNPVDDDSTPIRTLLETDESTIGEIVRSEVAGHSSGRRRHHGGMTYCLRDVRMSLSRMGVCHSNSFGDFAAAAYGPIRSQCGMKPAAYSANLPRGSVCISTGGNHRCGRGACGHAAVKIGSAAWKGAGVRPTPMLSHHGAPRCLVPR